MDSVEDAITRLSRAAEIGWRDAEAGRFTDLTAEELGGFIARIGDEVSLSQSSSALPEQQGSLA